MDGLASDNRRSSLDSGYRSPGRLEQDNEEEAVENIKLQKPGEDLKFGVVEQSDHERDFDLPSLSPTKYCVNDKSWDLPNHVEATYPVDKDLGEPTEDFNRSSERLGPPLLPRKWKIPSLSTLEEQNSKTVQDS